MTEQITLTPDLGQQPAFSELGLTDRVAAAVNGLGFTVPTPIQLATIPAGIAGRDVVGIAQTGTGKTLAFGIPIIEHLRKSGAGMALILAPTRELALQIDESLRAIGSRLGFRTAVLIGGAPMGRQIADLRARPRIIVATPGRLIDHMEHGTILMGQVTVLVLDEADRMLDMGFLPSIKKVLAAVPRSRQTMLFSATMPPEIATLARDFLRDPFRVDVSTGGETSSLVDQEMHYVHKDDKLDFLSDVLRREPGTVLVFARTRHGARKVAKQVRLMGHSAAELHSDRTLAQRKAALEGFKSGAHRVLVATDIAARGIDVKQISLVVNFDLPDQPEDYIHRIGRTGRAGESGRAVTMATPDQVSEVRRIERLIGQSVPGAASGVGAGPERRPMRQPQNRGRNGMGASQPVRVDRTKHVPHPVLEAPIGGQRLSASPLFGRNRQPVRP
jgi:ATP-dependent RNA helicase RhlE